MDEIKVFFEELNNIERRHIDNDLKANKVRKLFERIIKFKMNIPSGDYIKLSSEWNNYCEKYRPDNKYTGQELIRKLNRYSHDTVEKLTDQELRNILSKLNKLFEIVLSVKNPASNIVNNKNDYSDTLNNYQEKALLSSSRFTLANAGPGTGKTYLIVNRLIKVGIKHTNSKIVGLTFTNQAATNLKQRLEYVLFGSENYKIIKNIFIGTIHSFALKMLQEYSTDILNTKYEYDVVDDVELKEIEEEFNNDISLVRSYLRENKLLTFEQILKTFINELNSENFIKYVAGTIKEFVLDEAQDLNSIQYEILKKLTDYSTSINLFAVGDPRQNIFGFNGGTLNNLLNTFDRDNIAVFDLLISYRCPQKILDFVNTFTFIDCSNVDIYNPLIKGEKPLFYELYDKEQESEKILELIENIKQNYNAELNEIAILSNTSFYFDNIASVLNREDIPFKIFGGQTSLKSEIRFVLNLIKSIKLKKIYSLKKVLAFIDPSIEIEESEFVKIIENIKNQNLNKNDLTGKIIEFIENYIKSDENALSILGSFILYITNNNLFDSEIIKYYTLLSEKLSEVEKYDIDEISISISPNDSEFSIFYNRTADFEYKKELDNSNYITLSTIHSAKGKEWEYVIIIGLSQDTFPRYNTNDLNAELKKFYVACTRASKKLFFTRPTNITVRNHRGEWTFEKEKSIFLKNF